jgi:protein gp37
MSDLFHKDIPDSFILKVFDVMRRAHWHTFQVLTKRAARMFELVAGYRFDAPSGESWFGKPDGRPDFALLRNVHLGVSVEDQRAADERILFLLKAPAAVRFISGEPLLGAVNLRKIVPEDDELGVGYDALTGALCGNGEPGGPRIDWVIGGGESGPGARPCHPEWARALRDDCQSAGVPFFWKQWGEFLPVNQMTVGEVHKASRRFRLVNATHFRVGKKAAGRLLDGKEHNEFPRSQ